MKDKRVHALVTIIIVLFLALSSVSVSQETRPMMISGADLPQFYLDILNFPSDSAGMGRLDFYIQVPYEMLSFVKSEDRFSATYEVTIDVLDSVGNILNEKLWTESIITGDYQESISPVTGKISQRSIYLPPKAYTIVTQIRDAETKKISQVKRLITVREFSRAEFSLSDIMIVKQREKVEEKTAIIPNVAATVRGGEETISLYFQACPDSIPYEAVFLLNVQTRMGVLAKSDTLVKSLTKMKQSCFMDIEAGSFTAGEYTLELKAYRGGTTTFTDERLLARVTRTFRVRLQGMPFTISDLDLAVEQLMYITQKETLDQMREATGEKKRDLFISFWKQRDPTPGTESNELMQEYYTRVDYSNKNFTHYMDGWKSDRGNIYIVFGEPNNIERHPFNVDSKPYEIWTYYQINKEFVFVDETGFGDYRLRNPMWDVWRNRYR